MIPKRFSKKASYFSRFLNFELDSLRNNGKKTISRQEVEKDFKYVKLARTRICLDHFPDFMIIGPQRTGTTWLHRNLSQHPQIFLSNPKEIFYFNLLILPNHPKYRSNNLDWYLPFFYEAPIEYISKYNSFRNKFREPYQPKVRGEATASYAAMKQDLIREIVKLNPNVKAILLIRDPVARAWSDAKKFFLEQNRSLSDVSQGEFHNFFTDEYQLSCGHYSQMIQNWTSLLQEDRLFVGGFDEILTSPRELLLRIFNFLGVRCDPKYIGYMADQKINPTLTYTIPEAHKKTLNDIFQDEVEQLRERLYIP